MITVMKCLSMLKPLSIALSIQLQKLDSDIRLTPKLVLWNRIWKQPESRLRFSSIGSTYEELELGKEVDVEPAIPRIANRQQHRDNVPATTPVQYFQRPLCIPLMDHLIAQMDTYFSESQVNVSKLMCLVPEVLMSSSDTTINAEIQFYRDDLVSPIVSRWRWADSLASQMVRSSWQIESSNQCMLQPPLDNATLVSFPT